MLAFPQVLNAALLFRVDFEDWESALPHSVELFFLDEDRHPIATPKGIEIQGLPVGQDHFMHTVGLQDVIIQREGNFSIEIYLDGKMTKSIPFKTKLGQPDGRPMAAAAS